MTLSNTHSRIIFLSACASSTRGHRAIATRVREAVVTAGYTLDEALPATADTLSRRLSALMSDESDIPVLVIVDFPDVPYDADCLQLLTSVQNRGGHIMQLAMKTSSWYLKRFAHLGTAPFPYDSVVSLEPGACRAVVERLGDPATCRNADVRIAPIIQTVRPVHAKDFVIWHDECIARNVDPSRAFLWLQSGDQMEQAETASWLRAHVSEPIVPSYALEERARRARQSVSHEAADPSRQRPQLPTVGFCLIAPGVITAAGYSTFWELYALQALDRVRYWLQLPRHVEDIEGRIRLAREDKLSMLNASAPGSLFSNMNAGVRALAHFIRHVGEQLGFQSGSDATPPSPSSSILPAPKP